MDELNQERILSKSPPSLNQKNGMFEPYIRLRVVLTASNRVPTEAHLSIDQNW